MIEFRFQTLKSVSTSRNDKKESVKQSPTPPAVSAEALSAVRLKPTTRRDSPNNIAPIPAGFDSDLRNALAKRRTKVGQKKKNDINKHY